MIRSQAIWQKSDDNFIETLDRNDNILVHTKSAINFKDRKGINAPWSKKKTNTFQ